MAKSIKVSYAGCHHTHVFDSAEVGLSVLDKRGLGESTPVVDAEREIIGYHAWGMCSRQCWLDYCWDVLNIDPEKAEVSHV